MPTLEHGPATNGHALEPPVPQIAGTNSTAAGMNSTTAKARRASLPGSSYLKPRAGNLYDRTARPCTQCMAWSSTYYL
jgi:hypothetical protein